MNWKKKLALLAVLCLSLGLLAGCGNPSEDGGSDASGEEDGSTDLLSGKHHVTIEVENYGTIEVELDADAAPVTVTNFVSLAQDGFYDGLTFHRVAPGFVIQGGDPEGTGNGGSGVNIKGEFALNQVENPLSHTRGAISMARADPYDSASSQFFIVQEDATSLDGAYAAFGYVTSGLELVDRICENTPVADMRMGYVNPEDQPVITSITVVD